MRQAESPESTATAITSIPLCTKQGKSGLALRGRPERIMPSSVAERADAHHGFRGTRQITHRTYYLL
jgi:hypothetical protein